MEYVSGTMSLKKDKIGKKFTVLSLSAVWALAHFCTILFSQETSVNVIPLPWHDVSSKVLPSFSSSYFA